MTEPVISVKRTAIRAPSAGAVMVTSGPEVTSASVRNLKRSPSGASKALPPRIRLRGTIGLCESIGPVIPADTPNASVASGLAMSNSAPSG